jgi:hypothetical protein
LNHLSHLSSSSSISPLAVVESWIVAIFFLPFEVILTRNLFPINQELANLFSSKVQSRNSSSACSISSNSFLDCNSFNLSLPCSESCSLHILPVDLQTTIWSQTL